MVAHGAPGRVVFASDEWTINTLDGAADDLAAIGKSLGDNGELRTLELRDGSREARRGLRRRPRGTVGADVRATGSRVGAAALGGAWKLDMAKTCSAKTRPAALPPITAAGASAYAGVLAYDLSVDRDDSEHIRLYCCQYILCRRYFDERDCGELRSSQYVNDK